MITKGNKLQKSTQIFHKDNKNVTVMVDEATNIYILKPWQRFGWSNVAVILPRL